MKRVFGYPIVLSMLCMSLNSAWGQTYDGAIDWEKGTVRATGIGAPNPRVPKPARRPGALKAARNDALRNILETVKGINLSAETTVRDFMTESDVVRTNVRGVLRNFKIVDTRYLAEGVVEVDVEMPIHGALTNALMPAELFAERSEFSLVEPADQNYTGLIVDARGLGIRPAMAPRIFDETGAEVYGTGYVTRDYAIKIGVVGYAKDIKRAEQDSRVAENPLIVKAKTVSGANNTDVVISDKDARKIHGAAKSNNFLDQCRVMFILD